jgi:hypothetical protein
LSNGTAYTFTVKATTSYGVTGPSSAASNSITPAVPAARGIFAAGSTNSGTVIGDIQYITITTTGNATDFGDLSVTRNDSGGCASSTRGLFMGGYTMPSYVDSNVIDYITIASTGNATDFGDLTQSASAGTAFNSSTRGVRAGGYIGSYTNTIDYVTIASVGNATDFGDLTVARGYTAGASSTTRGLTMSGFGGSANNTIDYVTIASTGNATDFGDAVTARYYTHGASNNTRAVYGSGQAASGFSQNMEYVTIATTGNATTFGGYGLNASAYHVSACSDSTRIVFAGGLNGSIGGSFIDMRYITIATTGDATDFGDLTQALGGLTGLSNGNGGL